MTIFTELPVPLRLSSLRDNEGSLQTSFKEAPERVLIIPLSNAHRNTGRKYLRQRRTNREVISKGGFYGIAIAESPVSLGLSSLVFFIPPICKEGKQAHRTYALNAFVVFSSAPISGAAQKSRPHAHLRPRSNCSGPSLV